MKTKTFAMIKPIWSDSYRLSNVLHFIENHHFVIEEMKLQRLSKHDVDEFYQEHVGKHFYDAMRSYMCSGPVVGMVLSLESDYAFFPETRDGRITLRTNADGPPPAEPHKATAIYRWRHYLGATDSAKSDLKIGRAHV